MQIPHYVILSASKDLSVNSFIHPTFAMSEITGVFDQNID